MLLRLQTAAEAMSAMANNQERTANNLANANTVGYKADRSFVEALNERLNAEGTPATDLLVSQWADMSAGSLEQTGNPLDVAVGSDGFFVVSDPDTGTMRYTRAGRFMLDAEGTLRTPSGLLVEGTDGPVQFPPRTGEIQIDASGEVKADGVSIGRLQVVRFADPAALERADGATFTAGGMAPEEMEAPLVKQGFVEASNVDPLLEMTNMIQHFRLFESQQRLLQTTDSVLGQVTNDLGRF
jgi:flagellar basal-body rod protein FlgF/flagellar basal-body rod protein FlgG